ncbi:LPS biosynthesis glycosyltransferase [Bordetella genomosp. 7]|uniref:glycosyltransferase family 9 protein n=1 Tax=Bordetella TaxID=517 RepID=UPI00047B8568|nr:MULTISPECIES: glycosyltransferase family 9 protein [Bordetella]OZI27018.1 LPS biosynthesis glycosyltransferase [Bordetella genomosp. 7]
MNISCTTGGATPRIAVFRALQLGDMLCAVPALRALRQAFPQAHITLVGLPNARDFVQRFDRYIDDLLEFPGTANFPEQAAREQALPQFYQRAHAMQFDVALQMHGSGKHSNDIVRCLGARHWAGFVPTQAEAVPGCRMPWPDRMPEPLRYLALLRWLGLAAWDSTLELPVSAREASAAAALLRQEGLEPRRTVVMHVGARLPSRRWPTARFAQVAGAIAARGWQIALTGTPDEAALVGAMWRECGTRAANLCGRTTLGELAALVEQCRLVICNDTGMSHVAAAMRVPSVVVASGSDVRRWAPLDGRRHSVLSANMPCRPCSYDTCPIGHPCALAISADDVLARACRHLEEPHHVAS